MIWSYRDLKEWLAFQVLLSSHCFCLLAQQELKGQPLMTHFAKAISSISHRLAGKICVEELGQPHFDVLKTPNAAELSRQAPAHNAHCIRWKIRLESLQSDFPS